MTYVSNLGDSNPEKVEQGEQKFKVSLDYIANLKPASATRDLVKKERKERREGGREEEWMNEWMNGWMGKEKEQEIG